MERHPLDQRLPLDIWREIKTYIVHNIKTQGKHLKNEKSVINFNKTLKHLPIFAPPTNGPQIVYNSATRPVRVVRYLYHIQAFKPVDNAAEPYRDGKISLIVTCPLKFINGFVRMVNGNMLVDNLYHRLDYKNYWSGLSCKVAIERIQGSI